MSSSAASTPADSKGKSSSGFATDPSNPLNDGYFVSCLKSAQLYLNAAAKQKEKEAAAEGADTDGDATVRTSASGGRDSKSGGKDCDGDGEEEEVIDLDAVKKAKEEEEDSSLLQLPDITVRPAKLNQSVLGELTGHVDALKALCGGASASFITLNSTSRDDGSSHNAMLKGSHDAGSSHNAGGGGGGSNTNNSNNNSSSSSNSPFKWGGGGGGGDAASNPSATASRNVLLVASAAFALEQEALQEQYHAEVAALYGSSSDEDEDEEEEEGAAAISSAASAAAAEAEKQRRQQEKARAADNALTVRTVALMHAMLSSEEDDGVEEDGTKTNNKQHLLESIDTILSSSLVGGDAPPPLSALPLMERQLFKVVASMCEFAATVAMHTIRFTLQFPSKVGKKGGGGGVAGVAGGTLPPPLAGNDTSTSSSDHHHDKHNTDSPTSRPAAAAASASSLGGSGSGATTTTMTERTSSAVFEDSDAARASLSELTAQLMYHSMTIMTEAMAVFEGDSEKDRLLEMLDFFADRCEMLLAGVVPDDGINNSSLMSFGKGSKAEESPSSSAPSSSSHHQSKQQQQQKPTPHAFLTLRQQRIVACRKHCCDELIGQLYPFRRRIQMLLLDRLGLVGDTGVGVGGGGAAAEGASSTSSPSSPPSPSSSSSSSFGYLPLVFGFVSRDTELTWYAEGFRSLHMQLLANMAHNNRRVARAVAEGRAYAGMAMTAMTKGESSRKKGEGDNKGVGASADYADAVVADGGGHAHLKTFVQLQSLRSNNDDDNNDGGGAPATSATANAGGDVSSALPSAASPPPAADAANAGAASTPNNSTSTTHKSAAPDLFCSILQLTGLDPENPAIGEWSEYAVRCMCCVSMSARNKIQRLKTLVREEDAVRRAAAAKAKDCGGGDDGAPQPEEKYSYHDTFNRDEEEKSNVLPSAKPSSATSSSVPFDFAANVSAAQGVHSLPQRPRTWEEFEGSFM